VVSDTLASGAPILSHWKISIGCCSAYTIGPILADQHKQIGIRGGARSFQLRGAFMKQNGNFEKSQELKGRSEKFKNQ
jgi:hypothetical protein